MLRDASVVPMQRTLCFLASALAFGACGRPDAPPPTAPVEAISLLGDTLRAPAIPDSLRQAREAQLAEARAALERNPGDADAMIWVGRRLAYLGRYRDAIAAFTQGVNQHPQDARFYRHRGHRYISVRQLDSAIADFAHAAQLERGQPDEVEPDGQPNARNIPTSTLQFNIWYHLGLVYYLKGDFANALRAYQECLAVSKNPDAQVATSHWLYMTLRRLDRTAEAARVLRPISPDMDVIENGSYHRLLLLYQGLLPADSLFRLQPGGEVSLQDVTQAYGVGNWHRYNGRRPQADEVFRAIVAAKSQWAAFGYLAAEAELARN